MSDDLVKELRHLQANAGKSGIADTARLAADRIEELEQNIEILRKSIDGVFEFERQALAFDTFFDRHGAMLLLRKALAATEPKEPKA